MSGRVIHIINDLEEANGGAQNLLRKLHLGLLNAGVNDQVISLLPISRELERATSIDGKSVYALSTFTKLLNYLKTIEKNAVLHVHLFPAILYVTLAKRFLRLKNPIIFTEHSTSNRRRGKFWGRILDKFMYNTIDQVIAISEGAKNELIHWQNNVGSKIKVVYNGIELNTENVKDYRSKDTIKILSVGRLTRAKNFDTLILAFSQLKDQKVELHIAGDGELFEELSELISSNGLNKQVKLLGFKKGISKELQSYDIFILVSSWEGFGLAALEAMNHGLPIIVSKIPGLTEVAGDSALYVEPNSSIDIANAIMKLAASESSRMHLGKAAFERSMVFDIQSTINSYKKIYSAWF